MDIQEFFALLGEAKEDFVWYLEDDKIRCESNVLGRCFCPLTAVAYYKTGAIIDPPFYPDAGRELFLSHDNAADIAHASDNDAYPEAQKLRQQLLQIVDLSD